VDINFNRIKLTFLLDNCPLYQNNPTICPLHDLRGSSIENKNKWLVNLSDMEVEEILKNHDYCYSKKLIDD